MNDSNGLRPFIFLVFVRVSLVFRSGISDWHGEGVAIFISFFFFFFGFINLNYRSCKDDAFSFRIYADKTKTLNHPSLSAPQG